MALINSHKVAGIAINKVAMLISGLVFTGAIIVVAISWGLLDGFTGLLVSQALTVLLIIVVFSIMIGIAVTMLLKTRLSRLAAQLHIINETLPILIAKRYEKVDEQLQAITKSVAAEEIVLICEQMQKLAVSTASIDEQAARRVRESYSQTDTIRQELEHIRRLISTHRCSS